MKKMLLKIIVILVVVYMLIQAFAFLFPDWLRILINADPKYIDEAIKVAKETYKYDKEN